MKKTFMPIILALIISAFSIALFSPLCSFAEASEPIAVISKFKGDVVILSFDKVIEVDRTGMPLMSGDHVQTREGEAEVHFNEGAIMTISPFTSAAIQEREESSRSALGNVAMFARRITCFVGKVWFKSVERSPRHYLQTPTAVAGVRGSIVSVGYDGEQSALHIEEGSVDTVGKFVQGFFEAPGFSATEKSAVFKAIDKAATAFKNAESPLQQAEARVVSMEALKTVAETLKSNPDPTVGQLDGNLAYQAAEASVFAAHAAVAAEQIREKVDIVDQEIKAAIELGDEKKAAQLRKLQQQLQNELSAAETYQEAAETAAANAWRGVSEGDVQKVQDSKREAENSAIKAQDAQKNAQNARDANQEDGDDSSLPPTVEDKREDDPKDYTR